MTEKGGPSGRLLGFARATAGFLDEEEGEALAHLGLRAASSGLGPLVEIGAYCGRSTLFLAAGLAGARSETVPVPVLYSVDHHRGSEEMQAGWEHHDPSLVDARSGRMDSLPLWRRSVEEAGAEQLVVAVVGESSIVAVNWATPLSLVFVDGGHGEKTARADYLGWAPHVAPGGILAFHDVFPDPARGGRPPYDCYLAAVASGRFRELEEGPVGSLYALRAVDR